MDKRRSRYVPGAAFASENLEKREVLSTTGSGAAAEVASTAAGGVATKTTLKVSAGTLAQPVTLTATVKAESSGGAPTGTLDVVSDGQVIGTLALKPAKGGKSATSQVKLTMTFTPGGAALFVGQHQLTAEYVPAGDFASSSATSTFNVKAPHYKTLSDGVKVATVTPGSGAAIKSGQTASVMYTGYLASNGEIFDDSIHDGGSPFSFTIGSGETIPGFDAGTAGMKVGETRIISIPPSQGYGSSAVGSIPANSTLIFVVTLESIS